MDLQIPGPGAAMAIAAGIAAYATGLVGASDISDPPKQFLFFSMLVVTILFAVLTIMIEFLHVWKELKLAKVRAMPITLQPL